MTVPTVIASHKKEEVETRLKKFYTAVYNAHRLENINGNYMVDSDDVRSWFEKNIIEKHLNVAKYEPLKSINDVARTHVYYYSDGSSSYGPSGEYVKLSDVYCFGPRYDINGDKGPNKRGKDIFQMYFCEGITPQKINIIAKSYGYGYNNYSYSFSRQFCENNDSLGDYGSCFALIKRNGFKIPDDYPFKI